MDLIAEILISFFLIVSGIFGFTGSYGLIKLGDPMSRLHAPTKATTLGVGSVLIASLLYSIAIDGKLSLHELLITLFLLLTAPITANFIAKMHLHTKVDIDELPPTGVDQSWAVLETEDPGTDAGTGTRT
jgi:multicomponent K+:H+ antiporter subunit G